MLGSTIPVSIIGARFAIAVEPFWVPDQFGEFKFLIVWLVVEWELGNLTNG